MIFNKKKLKLVFFENFIEYGKHYGIEGSQNIQVGTETSFIVIFYSLVGLTSKLVNFTIKT